MGSAYPFFVFTSKNNINIIAVVDYAYWSLKVAAFKVVPNTCTSRSFTLGCGTVGLIGLGYQQDNYLKTALFSIYLYPDGNGGKLLFNTDMSLMANNAPVATLPCTKSNWVVTGVQFSIGTDSSLLQAFVCFDINTDAIGLPKATYLNFIKSMSTYVTGCRDISLPTCYNVTAIENFPTLSFRQGNAVIPIPPELYVQQVEGRNDQVTLGIRGLSSFSSGSSYVTEAYNAFIILGTNVMTYYYTVFNAGDSTISLYRSSGVDSPLSPVSS